MRTKANKVPETNWEQYESIPFAVLIHSTELGWITAATVNNPAEARRRYEAFDGKKMLLNYGMILAKGERLK